MGTPGSKTSEVRPLMRGGLGPGPENSHWLIIFSPPFDLEIRWGLRRRALPCPKYR